MPIQTAIDSISNSQGSPFGFKNRIMNGAMGIDQRNAGASVTANDNIWAVDRWQYSMSQSSKGTSQQNAGSVTPPPGFKNYVGFTSSSSYSVLSSDNFILRHHIEGNNIADLDWGSLTAKPVTFSFWVRSSLTGTFSGALNNNPLNRVYVFTYTISSSNTWEYKTITIPGDTTGTWLTDTGRGIMVSFSLGSGSTYTTSTPNTWQTATQFAGTGSTSVVGTNGATFYVTGCQLEVGRQATNFDFRSYTTELQLCQRYFTRFGPFSLEAYQGSAGFVRALNTIVPLPVEMRTTPSRTVNTTGSSNIIRTTVTDYSGLNPVSAKHLNAYLETNNTTGVASISGRVESFDAEL
jgi:hypothetical protein